MPVLFPEAPMCTPEGCACPPTPETPYENLCCCTNPTVVSTNQNPPLTTFPCYYVMQPACQVIPAEISGLEEDITSQNPCFINGNSYWTYKLFLPCGGPTPGLSHLEIPICENITEDQIRVFEKVDCCGGFRELSFADGGALDIKDTFEIPAPEFFNWLKIDNEGAYSAGVCVTYLLCIEGNFQVATGPILLKQANALGTFNCDPETCFQVPGCLPSSGISVTKECPTVSDAMMTDDGTILATLTYQAVITNTGDQDVTIDFFEDNITIPAGGTFVSGTVSPTPQFTISGAGNSATVTGPNVSDILLTPGTSQIIDYSIVVEFDAPGTYLFDNTAEASGEDESGTEVSDSVTNTDCEVLISGVTVAKCCTIDEETGEITFNVTLTSAPNSPAVTVDFEDELTIPEGLTVTISLDPGCTSDPAIVNPVAGPATFTITCEDTQVPEDGGSVTIPLTVTVDTVPFDCMPRDIENVVTAVTGVDLPDNQVLVVDGLPATATATVEACIMCSPACFGNGLRRAKRL